MDVYEFSEALSERGGYSSLREFERTILIIVTLEAEVNNGGFSQFYFNSAGSIANEAPTALDRIGAPIMAGIVIRANANFGSNVPLEQVARQTKLEKLEGTSEDFFDELDDEFLAYPEDLTNLLQQYYAQQT